MTWTVLTWESPMIDSLVDQPNVATLACCVCYNCRTSHLDFFFFCTIVFFFNSLLLYFQCLDIDVKTNEPETFKIIVTGYHLLATANKTSHLFFFSKITYLTARKEVPAFLFFFFFTCLWTEMPTVPKDQYEFSGVNLSPVSQYHCCSKTQLMLFMARHRKKKEK